MASHASGREGDTVCITPKLRAGKGRGKGEGKRASDDDTSSSSDNDDDDSSSCSSTASSCAGGSVSLKGTRRMRQTDSDWSAFQDDDFSDGSRDF